jgi:hypothetical protein
MSVRNENRIEFRNGHRGLVQALTAGFARIDQHRGLRRTQQDRGKEPSLHRRARTRAEEQKRIHGRLLTFRARGAQAVALARGRTAL